MPQRPCLDCGKPTSSSRCGDCRRGRERKRYHTTPPTVYDHAWRQHSKAVREQWVALNGWVCPGWQRDTHGARDLVVDHDVGVLCRSCNSSKAATHDRQRAATQRDRGRGHPHNG